MRKRFFTTTLALAGAISAASWADHPPSIEEVRVWGEREEAFGTTAGPSGTVLPEDIRGIHLATTEDLVKFEPGIAVRRRFIGDANGTLAMRGSNMFQTSRSMVFADGVPLHYLLESRWSGAPRWTLVSASEIAQVDILYGPYSAEYSGNAMGGVINIETAIPDHRRIRLEGSLFSQEFAAYGFNAEGFDNRLNGGKGFASYGDRFGDLSLYVSWNHLVNNAQAQSYYYGASSDETNPKPVTGALPGPDSQGNPQLYFGDSGVVHTTTDNIKIKVGYDWEIWSTLFNLAYEDRRGGTDQPNSYLRTEEGQPVWGGAVVQNDSVFNVPSSRLTISDSERDSLSAGWRLRGELNDHLNLEANLSHFDILRDETRTSAVHPDHPDASLNEQVADYDNTGWQTAELKLDAEDLGRDGLSFMVGVRTERYELNQSVYASDHYIVGDKSRAIGRSGGITKLDAAYAQLNWPFADRWDLTLGARYELWHSEDGYFSRSDESNGLRLTEVPGNRQERTSPKLSLGFQPTSHWQWRYSLARAYRFPIVEELFSQFRAYNAVSEANPDLAPEDGLHHNLMFERQLDSGVLRINLFQESVKDVVESQTDILPGGTSVRTFVPVDRVDTRGADFTANLEGLWHPRLDLRFNLTYTHAEIARNTPDPSIEGNRFPRMPRWRGNLIASYGLTPAWELSTNLQYASDSVGRLDNTDNTDGVYGAQDAYRFLGLKARYQRKDHWRFSVGVDNILDERAYVAHPWPGRTVYTNFSYDWH